MMFWIIISGMVVIAAAFIFIPLFRFKELKTPAPSTEVEFYKAQLREIEKEISTDQIKGEEARTAKLEIERRLIKAANNMDALPPPNKSAIPVYLMGVICFIFSGGVFFYLNIGTPEMPDFQLSKKEEQRGQNPKVKEINAYIAKIHERLAENPNEKMGWIALAHFEGQLGHSVKTARAFERALALDPENYNLHVMLGESLTIMSRDKVPAAARMLFDKALKLSDKPYGARYYLALSDYQNSKQDAAYQAWKELEKVTHEKEPWAAPLKFQLAKAAKELGFAPKNSSDQAPDISTEQRQAVMDMAPEDRQNMIRSMVEGLAERLKDQPDDLAGWKRLGRSYMVLGKKAKAAKALSHAASLAKGDEKKEIKKLLEKLTIQK